jgi:hypothetical protein
LGLLASATVHASFYTFLCVELWFELRAIALPLEPCQLPQVFILLNGLVSFPISQ